MLSDFPRPRAWRRDADISVLCTRSTRSPRSIKKRSSDPETCRQSSIAQTRSPQAARPAQQSCRALGARRDRLLAEHFTRRRSDCGDRVRALVGVRTEHDH